MKQLSRVSIFAILIALSMSLTSCFNRIDAGHVGIKVNLYGSDKGVSDITEVTGMVWYNPFTKRVYEVPTFVQNVTYSVDNQKGEFRVTTKDGMIASFDLSMNYYTPSENVTRIFRKYRKPVYELEAGVLKTFLREAFNNVATQFTAEGLYENRAKFEELAEAKAREILEKEGFTIEQIVILNEIRLPQDVTQRINDKVKAAQITKQKEEEVRQEKADADKKIEKARGQAESMRILAVAEAEAYRIKKQELNSLLIQQQFVEKWDGKLPVYGQVPELFRTISK
jgi:regulator of protease activity HflC (stomatin/prohibitin superfamily)